MKKIIAFFLLLIGLHFAFPFLVYGDVGPKPSLEIIVKNPPQTEYYLDLLVDYKKDHLYQNIRNKEVYSEKMYHALESYYVDGWRPALVTGTSVPLNGHLIGNQDGNNMIHKFSYVGVPDRFKLIIVTANDETIISDNIINRKAFNSTTYFDCKTKKLTESSLIIAYLLQFIATCSITLLIEGLILLLFSFSIKKNWKPFLAINVLTQILLTLVIFSTMYFSGSFAAILLYIPFELIILIIEIILFAKYLTQHSKARRITFAIVGNMISFLLGLVALLYFPGIL
ncbi:MAG: hypothetical protein GX962_05095 [Epulopiscium sp.]|nr:hypothetical protein [Candidatus Epulonipiscium sp.]